MTATQPHLHRAGPRLLCWAGLTGADLDVVVVVRHGALRLLVGAPPSAALRASGQQATRLPSARSHHATVPGASGRIPMGSRPTRPSALLPSEVRKSAFRHFRVRHRPRPPTRSPNQPARRVSGVLGQHHRKRADGSPLKDGALHLPRFLRQPDSNDPHPARRATELGAGRRRRAFRVRASAARG